MNENKTVIGSNGPSHKDSFKTGQQCVKSLLQPSNLVVTSQYIFDINPAI